MEIKEYISIIYPTVYPYEGINAINDKLIKEKYLVVTDEDKKYYGILTPCDIVRRPHKLVIDCLIEKEIVSEKETLDSVLRKFYANQSYALPVYQDGVFIGIIEKNKVFGMLKQKIEELYVESLKSQSAKECFLNNLSHEIRTPLNHIFGFLNILSKLEIEKINKKEEPYIKIIEKSKDHFLLIMNDLIELSLMHSGNKIQVVEEKVEIEILFIEMKKRFETKGVYLGKEFTVNYENPDKTLNIYRDGEKLEKILYHLIDNAIKHSEDKSHIIFGYELTENEINFFVKNTGSQIRKEDYQKIYEAFEKNKTPENDFKGGLGIGLTLSRKLAETLEGKLYLTTDKENLMKFILSIPISSSSNENKNIEKIKQEE